MDLLSNTKFAYNKVHDQINVSLLLSTPHQPPSRT